MYAGVDIGGTKTILAALDDNGVIKEKALFPTPKTYDNFILELKHKFAHFAHQEFRAGAIGLRGIVDREHGRPGGDNVLPWKGKPLQADAEQIFACPVLLENDAKLAGLSEAMLIKDSKRVVYVTVSTGIGFALIVDGKIDTNLADLAGQTLLLEHKGKMTPWEDFVGGKAIVRRYGKKAQEINDQKTWRAISRDLAKGMVHLRTIMEPDVIVIGGSVGEHFQNYAGYLKEELEKYHLPLVKMPALKQAQRPTEAVIFGCYDLAKQAYGHAKTAK